MNTTDTPDLPVPPGAVSDGWHRLADDADDYVRCLTWARFDTDRVGVAVDGCQFSDGLIDAVVSLYDVKELSAADARGLAAALSAAADELDRLDPFG